MAKAQYIGVGGIARKVSGEYVGVSGIARKVKSGYIGVSGVARQFFLGEFTWKKYTVRYENTSTEKRIRPFHSLNQINGIFTYQ